MRWTDKPYSRVRVCRAFLLFPKCIGYEKRWLEWACWERKEVWTGFPSCFFYTDDLRWVD